MTNLTNLKKAVAPVDVMVDPNSIGYFMGFSLTKRPEGYAVSEVMEEMKKLDLPEEAHPIRSRSAILRALRQAAKGKTLAILVDNDEKILFQLTNISVEDDKRYGKIAKYFADAHITFNKKSAEGDPHMIQCDNSKVRTYVLEKFLICKENYPTAQLTKILLRLFKKHGDVVPLRDQGGAYMVPAAFKEYVDKVKILIEKLDKGNKVTKFAISRTPENVKELLPSVTASNAKEIKALREELRLMEEEDEQRAKEGKKLWSDSPTKRKNRVKRLAQLRRRVELWEKTLQYDAADLHDLIRRCKKQVQKYFSAESEK